MRRLLLTLALLGVPVLVSAQPIPGALSPKLPPVVLFPASAVNGAGVLTTPCLTFPTGTMLCDRATSRSLAQTAAVASVAAYTVGAADGSFEVSANLLITSSTTFSFTVRVSYTDEGNTARIATMDFSCPTGQYATTIDNATIGAVACSGRPLRLRAKAATAITISTSGTFTTVTYNVEGSIRQVS